MKRKSSFLLLSMLMLTLMACFNYKDKVILKDDSKVLATVEGKNITQQKVDILRKTSFFSEEEIIEKLIDDELLLIKSKELKISATDDEVKAEVDRNREMMEEAENKEEVKVIINDVIRELGLTEDEYWSVYATQAYKKVLIIGKMRQKLGSDTDKAIKQLREKAKIKYYNQD